MENSKLEVWVVFVFGVLALSALFAVAILAPDHNALLITISRVTLALACAGIAAIIPGFLDVELGKGAINAIRAGGALAVFVLVFFFNPPALIAPVQEYPPHVPTPDEDYMPAINTWLRLIDAGDIASAYRIADEKTREEYSLELFRSLYTGYVKPLGKLQRRKLLGANSALVLPTGEKGNFRIITYETKFENGPAQIERILVTAKGGKWYVRNHTFVPKPATTP